MRDETLAMNMTEHLARHDLSSRVTGIATVGLNVINTVMDEFTEAVATSQFSTQSAEFKIEVNEGEAIHLEQAMLTVNYRAGEDNNLTVKSQYFKIYKRTYRHELGSTEEALHNAAQVSVPTGGNPEEEDQN